MTTCQHGRYSSRRGSYAAAVAIACCFTAAGQVEHANPAPAVAVSATAAATTSPSLTHPAALEPDEFPHMPETVAEMLQVDDEMRRYFATRVTSGRAEAFGLRQIVRAIVDPAGLHFRYDAEATCDARETFRRRRGNCLSFSILVVAIAREHQFEAAFQSLVLPAKWDRYGEIIASLQHVNVHVETDEGPMIVDLRPDLVPRADLYALKRISDESVLGFFHSDSGFFLLVHGRTDEALRAMVRATEIDPDSATSWGNRATLLSRLGDLAGARRCFEQSLRLDHRGISTLVGYVDVLQRLGTPDDLRTAKKYEGRAQRLREQNPYYHEYLARRALDLGDLSTAEKALRRAIWLKEDEPEFYSQWITTLQQLGRTKDADRAARKLADLRARLAARSEHVVR